MFRTDRPGTDRPRALPVAGGDSLTSGGADAATLATAAALLSIERIAYVLIARAPEAFRRTSRALPGRPIDPVDVLVWLFIGFKVLQILIFVWSWGHDGYGMAPASANRFSLAAGVTLLAAGQALNLLVFQRLGRIGVFYGRRLGHDTPWHEGFPFSWFRHPQYVGTVISIWGAFVLMRYPTPDWHLLPALETLYYAIGARLEQEQETPESEEA